MKNSRVPQPNLQGRSRTTAITTTNTTSRTALNTADRRHADQHSTTPGCPNERIHALLRDRQQPWASSKSSCFRPGATSPRPGVGRGWRPTAWRRRHSATWRAAISTRRFTRTRSSPTRLAAGTGSGGATSSAPLSEAARPARTLQWFLTRYRDVDGCIPDSRVAGRQAAMANGLSRPREPAQSSAMFGHDDALQSQSDHRNPT